MAKEVQKVSDIYGGVLPRDVAAYTLSDAARTVRVSRSTLAAWFLGQAGFRAVLTLADPRNKLLSFTNLIEAHVLAAIRRRHNVSLKKVRHAVQYLRKYDHPLADVTLLTDSNGLFVQKFGRLVDVSDSGQTHITEVLKPYLARIDRDSNNAPIRLYPLVTDNVERDERIIVIDPVLQFGRPVIASCGTPTEIIAERMTAGDSILELAQDYGCKETEIEEAIRFELNRNAA
jgi:uncharacterized protein (DUF433 family)